MANGQTMATVLVRCLDVCVTRHLLDVSLESPPLMVVVALSWMAVPLSSSRWRSFRRHSYGTRQLAGFRIGDPLRVAFLHAIAGHGDIASLLAAHATVNASER